jgi:hypothetical protein
LLFLRIEQLTAEFASEQQALDAKIAGLSDAGGDVPGLTLLWREIS